MLKEYTSTPKHPSVFIFECVISKYGEGEMRKWYHGAHSISSNHMRVANQNGIYLHTFVFIIMNTDM